MKKTVMQMAVATMLLTACGTSKKETASADDFNYTVEQFADLQILRYKVKDFDKLTLKQKELVYYLSQAALEGRDILFDQNGKYNLIIRQMLETVYTDYQGDRTDSNFVNMEVYLKRVWFSNGIHHHYAADKFVPGFTPEFFKAALQSGMAESRSGEFFLPEFSPRQLQHLKIFLSDNDLFTSKVEPLQGDGGQSISSGCSKEEHVRRLVEAAFVADYLQMPRFKLKLQTLFQYLLQSLTHFQSHCFSRLHDCDTFTEMIPILTDNRLK